MAAARLIVAAAGILAAAFAMPARAQTATLPGPAVPILPETPPPPGGAPPPMGTLTHATPPVPGMAPSVAPAAAPAATLAAGPPGGTGSLPVSNKPSNLSPADTTSPIAPPLPPPPLDDNAPPAAFLRAARAALVAGRTGEAQEALERAESRALDRAVRRSQADTPSAQPLVREIAAARQSLADPDRRKTVSLIDAALRNRDAGVK